MASTISTRKTSDLGIKKPCWFVNQQGCIPEWQISIKRPVKALSMY